ncbi:hypothetical protein DFH09DRAFT_1108876 [Mycena vulgaris]|nr:hypothetical protein DFH09DRAFT_1108876 [Mycena vulgaris]
MPCIESYLDSFSAELNQSLSGKKLTEWKQKIACEILDSPQFSDLDIMMVPRATCSLSGTTVILLPSDAAARVSATNHGSLAAVYQTMLKEQWNVLFEEDQLHWEEWAEAETGDVEKNQAELSKKMHTVMSDLCQGSMLGATELMLFYAFHKLVHGRLVHNKINFRETRSEMQTNYRTLWGTFTEAVVEDGFVPGMERRGAALVEISLRNSGARSPTRWTLVTQDMRLKRGRDGGGKQGGKSPFSH